MFPFDGGGSLGFGGAAVFFFFLIFCGGAFCAFCGCGVLGGGGDSGSDSVAGQAFVEGGTTEISPKRRRRRLRPRICRFSVGLGCHAAIRCCWPDSSVVLSSSVEEDLQFVLLASSKLVSGVVASERRGLSLLLMLLGLERKLLLLVSDAVSAATFF